METTGAKTRAGRNPSGAEEMTAALTGLVGELGTFRDDVMNRLHKQEERLTMLDRKTIRAGRPALSAERDAQWRRVSEAAFLTAAEKRALLGLPEMPDEE